jgi:hypothetical protein
MAGAIFFALPRLRRIRYCAGSIWRTRSTNSIMETCSASAAPLSSEHEPGVLRFQHRRTGFRRMVMASTTCASATNRTSRYLRFCICRKKQPRTASQSIGKLSGTTSTRACSKKFCDEVFHMNYTYTQLTRISPGSYRRRLWRARASRLWKQYLRVASAIAGVFGTIVLTVVYFILLPPFAWLAKRAERREPAGWAVHRPERNESLTGQY